MNTINLKFEILLLFLAMFFFLPEVRSQEIDEQEKQKQEEALEEARIRAAFHGENLEYVVRCNKTEYFLGEPVFVKYSIKTDSWSSPNTFVLGGKPGTLDEKLFWLTRRFQLGDIEGNVNKTEFGKYIIIPEFDYQSFGLAKLLLRRNGMPKVQETDVPEVTGFLQIKFNEEMSKPPFLQVKSNEEMSRLPFSLNQLFDISQLGNYCCSCTQYVAKFARGLNPPQKSNTISFRIKSGPPFRSSGLKEPGSWNGVTEKSFEYFDDLPPSGDYSKLKYVLCTNKKQYKEAEPVFLRLFLKNESDDTITVCVGGDPHWMSQSWSLVYQIDEVLASTLPNIEQIGLDPAKVSTSTRSFFDRYDQIQREGQRPKLRLGQLRFPDTPRDATEVDWVFEKPSFAQLGPGDEVEMEPGEIQLNLYYDLSTPGKYVFKCQRSTVIPGQKFDSPLESNEVEFEITSGSRFEPSDLVDPGCFDNTEEQIGESSENWLDRHVHRVESEVISPPE